MKLIIVEDDYLLGSIYHDIFSDYYDTSIFSDPLVALAHIKKERYDLLLLDIMLPAINGVELLSKIRQTKNGKSLPVIGLTNLSDGSVNELKELGALDVLLKVNYDPDELLAVVQSYLS